MKIFKKISLIATVAAVITVASCKKLLQENPKDGLYPNYLQSEPAIKGAIGACYSQLSHFYTNDGDATSQNQGTDEFVNGSSSTSPQFGNYAITSTNGPGFTTQYQLINTLNGAIAAANTVTTISASNKQLYLAEAQFLRAFYYFYLVQTFGNIPLHTTFSTTPSTADAPSKMSDVYNQIIQDLTFAAANLPNTVATGNPFSANGTGRTATAGVANALLAKVYLTRGYTSAGSSADFTTAATMSASVIANKTTYGFDLWQDYADVNRPANDYGKETMLAFDVGADPVYSGYCCGNGRGYNQLPVLYRWSYNSAGVSNIAGNDLVPQKIGGPQPMVRDVYNGRSYVRVAVNRPYAIDVAFADQVHDSRFDATFQTFWISNQVAASGTKFDGVTLKGVLNIASNVSFVSYAPPAGGDTAILMPGVPVTNARRDNFKGLIVTPQQYSNTVYPAIKKFDDITRTATNDHSTRPVIYMKFAEVYLINAEANYMAGNTVAAAQSLNVLRTRAAYRTPADGLYIPKGQFSTTAATQATDNANNAAAMQLTGAQLAQLAIPNNTTVGSPPCGMDLILEEYTRELYGDARRWYDLTRTGQLLRRVKLYNAEASTNIQPYHVLRPIPQTEINGVLTGPAYPQNPGY